MHLGDNQLMLVNHCEFAKDAWGKLCSVLPPSYITLVLNLESQVVKLKLADILARLLLEEQKRIELDIVEIKPENSFISKKKFKQGPCNYCKKKGHWYKEYKARLENQKQKFSRE
ncbi:hypothetical protein AYI69_g2595 [Smittium culicis]|uniref:Uncharacterized protein n=1 Tax=Smittium culicis TaxID=133412 RepID=A0A1R1YMI2_9FUNG|nr:hypothetical protein AYI69_g2595 [Smittium culicis]